MNATEQLIAEIEAIFAETEKTLAEIRNILK